MPVFRWQGVSADGARRHGELTAASIEAAAARLRRQRIEPIPGEVRERGRGLDRELRWPGFAAGLSARELAACTRQLAVMIDAGLPVMQCLDMLATQGERSRAGRVFGELRDAVATGAGLAEALRAQPASFDALYCSLVAAGEAAGALDAVLDRLAEYTRRTQQTRRRVHGALLYPAAVLLVSVAVTAALLVFVVPVFAALFGSLGAALPAPTRLVMAASQVAVAHAQQAALLAIVVAVAAVRLRRNTRVRRWIDASKLHAPIAGKLVRDAATARVARTLATLLSAGVPLLDAMEIAADTAGNAVTSEGVSAARRAVAGGSTLAEALAHSGAFAAPFCRMIAVGEATGKLDSTLGRIADAQEQEVEQTAGNLTVLLEPLVIVFLGLLIGGLVISMYLPIFRLGTLLG